MSMFQTFGNPHDPHQNNNITLSSKNTSTAPTPQNIPNSYTQVVKTMGIHGLTKVLGDNAPSSMKENEIKNYFGRFKV